MSALCRALGRTAYAGSQRLGSVVLCAGRIAAAARHGRLDRDAFCQALLSFGVASLPLTLVTSVFMGLMLVLQSAAYVSQYGAQEMLGAFTGFSVLRELGPVVLGLMLSGRVGANNAAELATLGATERLAALDALQVDVHRWLLLPRTLAMMVAQGCLLMFFNVAALGAGALGAWGLLAVRPAVFARSVVEGLHLWDLLIGTGKATVFGGVVALISCALGCAYRGAATGVGQAVRQQVVASAVCLFALDYGLSVALLDVP